MLKLYNSLTKKLETFKPLKKWRVSMYNCGPTVYDFAHIGNLCAYAFADLLRRYLEYRGYKVKQVMNITDVGHMVSDADIGEDKMEKSAREKQQTPQEIAKFYTKAFFQDIKTLGILKAWKYPRASAHVKEMIKIIKKLLARGLAYEVKGSVYFDVEKFPGYGRLSGNSLENLKAGAREEVKDIPEKHHPYDFALWINNPNHLMQWASPWGRGYPGWHIECSAMSMKYLGPTLDIHTGGEDNKFPHHECEIAQSEGVTGKQFVKYWLHVKHLLVDGKKMSKSLGNFYTLKDLLDKEIDPRVVRLALLSAHYRDTLNFTWDGLHASGEAIKRWDEVWSKLQNPKSKIPNSNDQNLDLKSEIKNLKSETARSFQTALDDDLNTPSAIAVVHEFVTKINQYLEVPLPKSEVELRTIRKLFQQMVADVLGIKLKKRVAEKIPLEIKKFLTEREEARKARDWAKADELRHKIRQAGYEVEDGAEGAKIKKFCNSVIK